MSKQVVVMSGVTSGFGVDWLKGLYNQLDATFYILARNKVKFERLIEALPAHKRDEISFVECDVASFESICNAISQIKGEVSAVDLLVNNAGVFPNKAPLYLEGGIEQTFAINHLAPLLITLLLKDKLIKSKAPKIINTSSFQHANASLQLNDVHFKHSKFNALLAYQNSKLCITLSTRYLAKHLPSNITVTCYDPGIVDTAMTKQAVPTLVALVYPLFRLFFRSSEKGAETGVYLSLEKNSNLRSGGYYRDKLLKEPSKDAKSTKLAERLHVLSLGYIKRYLV